MNTPRISRGLWRPSTAAALIAVTLALVLALTATARQPHATGIHATKVKVPLKISILEDNKRRKISPDGSNLLTIEAKREIEAPTILGYDKDVWLELRSERPIAETGDFWLDLQSPLLDEALLFEPKKDGRMIIRPPIGTEHPFTNRDVPHRSPIFIVHAQEGETLVLYLHLKGNNSMIIDPLLAQPQAYVAELTKNEALLIGLILLTFASLIACIWVAASLNSLVFGLLSAWILINLVRLVSMTGIAYQYLLHDLPGASDVAMFVSWAIGALVMAAFAFCYTKAWGRWSKLYLLFAALTALLTVTLILREERHAIETGVLLYALNDIALLCSVIWQTAKGVRAATGLLWALTGMTVGSSVQLAYFSGYAGDFVIAKYGYFLGLLILIFVLLHTAISKQREILKKESDMKARELERHKQVEAQLEFEVSKRTAALKQTMKRLTESLALEQRSRHDQRRFVMMLSHELRTPLSVIHAAVVNIELDLPNENEALRLRCNRIRSTVEKMISLINTCITAKRYLSGAQSTSKVEVDVYSMLYEAHDAARAISTQHHFRIDLTGFPDTLICDSAMTTLALRTVACNAALYTPPGTTITFRGRVEDGGALLEVSDDGPGVHPEDFPHLFQRFFRGRNATENAGTGMGLALAREMIEAQGGLLTANNNPGIGFTVRIWLPLAALTCPVFPYQ